MNCKAILLKPKYLKSEKLKKDISDYVLNELKGFDMINKKNDPELIKFIISVIELQITDKKIFKDVQNPKMEIFKFVCKKLYPNINNDEIETMIGVANYLIENKMFLKVSVFKVIKKYFLKKF